MLISMIFIGITCGVTPRSYIVVQEDLQEEKAAHETEMLRSHSADKDMSLI